MKGTFKILKITAMIVVGGLLLMGAVYQGMGLSRGNRQAANEKEAFNAGVVYGQRAGDLARAKGQVIVTMDDSAIDDLRITLTSGRYESARLRFIEGFRSGYQSYRSKK